MTFVHVVFRKSGVPRALVYIDLEPQNFLVIRITVLHVYQLRKMGY